MIFFGKFAVVLILFQLHPALKSNHPAQNHSPYSFMNIICWIIISRVRAKVSVCYLLSKIFWAYYLPKALLIFAISLILHINIRIYVQYTYWLCRNRCLLKFVHREMFVCISFEIEMCEYSSKCCVFFSSSIAIL